MKLTRLFSVLFTLIFIHTFNIQAQIVQDTTAIWQIRTLDDNEYIGSIISETEKTIEFRTATIGIITLKKSQIRKREKLRSDKSTNGLLWASNPLASRYFWANSGYNLKKGEGYYQNTWVLFNHAQFGVSDQFNLGVGTVPLFLFNGQGSPFWISPKFSLPVKKDQINIAAGMLFGAFFRSGDNTNFGFAYGNATFGSRDNNLTLGLGYGLADGDWADRPTFSLSGMLRLSKRSYLITENYYIDFGFDEVAILSLGGRYTGTKLMIDYGGIFPADSDITGIVPWLSVTFLFGGRGY